MHILSVLHFHDSTLICNNDWIVQWSWEASNWPYLPKKLAFDYVSMICAHRTLIAICYGSTPQTEYEWTWTWTDGGALTFTSQTLTLSLCSFTRNLLYIILMCFTFSIECVSSWKILRASPFKNIFEQH